MKIGYLALCAALLVTPVIAGPSEDAKVIRDEMVAAGAGEDIAFKLNNAYDVYQMAEFCQRTGSTTKEDVDNVAAVAKHYEGMINLPELQTKLWGASAALTKSLLVVVLDRNVSHAMCLDVRDSVDKVILELKEPDPKLF